MVDAEIDTVCPWCYEAMRLAHYVEGESARPVPGDVSLCAYCKHPGVFTDTMAIRKPTIEEADEILAALIKAFKARGD